MIFSTLRSCALVAALGFFGLGAAEPAFAQATDRPPGGVGSTTAPSNSEGTPSGGSGVVARTRVGPSTTARPATRTVRRQQTQRRARAVTPARPPATAAPITQ